MKEEGAKLEDKVNTIKQHIIHKNKQLIKAHKFMVERIQKLNEAALHIDAERRFEFEQSVNKLRRVLIDFLFIIHSNIEYKTKLNLDTDYDLRLFSDLLKKSSNETATRLKLGSNLVKQKNEQIDKSIEADKARLNAELAVLNERRNGLLRSLSTLVSMMKKQGLNTTEYSQLLITSSGAYSHDADSFNHLSSVNIVLGILILLLLFFGEINYIKSVC